MSWVYLIIAGLLEIGWPLGLKLAQQDGYRWHGIVMAIIFMSTSWILLKSHSKRLIKLSINYQMLFLTNKIKN